MESKWYAWLVALLGVVLLLPNIGVTQFGDLTTGLISWIVPLIVLLVGIIGIIRVHKK